MPALLTAKTKKQKGACKRQIRCQFLLRVIYKPRIMEGVTDARKCLIFKKFSETEPTVYVFTVHNSSADC